MPVDVGVDARDAARAVLLEAASEGLGPAREVRREEALVGLGLEPRRRERERRRALARPEIEGLRDDRAARGLAHHELFGRAPLHGDALAAQRAGHERVSLAHREPVGRELLQEEVGVVAVRGRRAPRGVAVVPDHPAGEAHEHRARGRPLGGSRVGHVPAARQRRGQVRIGREQGLAALGARAAHGPRVRAAALPCELAQVLEIGERRAEHRARLRERGRGDRERLEVVRLERAHRLFAVFFEHELTHELDVPVGREREREERADGRQVGAHHAARLGAEQHQIVGARAASRAPLVEPAREGLVLCPDASGRGEQLGRGGAPKADRAREPIDGQPLFSGDLGERAPHEPHEHLELARAILPLREAQAEEHVVVAVGLDVGHAVRVAADGHRARGPR